MLTRGGSIFVRRATLSQKRGETGLGRLEGENRSKIQRERKRSSKEIGMRESGLFL